MGVEVHSGGLLSNQRRFHERADYPTSSRLYRLRTAAADTMVTIR